MLFFCRWHFVVLGCFLASPKRLREGAAQPKLAPFGREIYPDCVGMKLGRNLFATLMKLGHFVTEINRN